MWTIVETEKDEVVAKSVDGTNWEFLDEEFQRAFETLLIEGIARGRKNYVPGDKKFDDLFWEELSSLGYDVGVEAEDEEVEIMPKAMLDKLPSAARKIYEEAYEGALETYDDDEEKAARVAITAVKNAGYEKDEESGDWVKTKKADLCYADMYFTKASLDPETGEMRWSATVSKFEEDDQGDEVTPEFYKNAIAVIDRGVRPSPVLCVSHVDKGRPSDEWVAGDTESMYIDGELPKAKGTFRPTEIGKATFDAVQNDIKNSVPVEERVRISMGFYDEGSIPKSNGKGRKFLDGWVKHFAATRVPVVKETDITVEKSEGSVTTIKEDAASIIGEELAEKLLAQGDREDKGLIVKQEGDGDRADQVKALVEQLLAILPETEAEDIDVDGLRRALGNRGTNANRAQEPEYRSQVEEFVDSFSDLVKSTILGTGDRTEKFAAIQQGLDQFGKGVEQLVKGNTPPSSGDISEAVQSAVLDAIRPLQQELVSMKAQLEGLQGGVVPKASPRPQSMDSRVQMPSAPLPPTGSEGGQMISTGVGQSRKVWKAKELAWKSTAEPRY